MTPPTQSTNNDTDNAQTTEYTYAPGESYKPTIVVERDVLPLIVQHAMELYWDGSTPTKRLDERDDSSLFTRFVNARIEGKLSEVAFTQLLEYRFNVRAAVDYRIYGDYETTDNGDLQYLLDDDGNQYDPGVEFDLKKTKPWNSWLAIRSEIYDKIEQNAPVILSKMYIDPELQVDPWENADSWDDVNNDGEFRNRLLSYADDVFPVEIEFVGTAYPDEFTDSFDQGEKLYDPVNGADIGPPLKRPNEGIAVRNLNSRADRWNRIVADICANMPRGSWRPLPIAESPRE